MLNIEVECVRREMAKMLEYGKAPAPATSDSVTVYYSTVHHEIANIPGESAPHKVVFSLRSVELHNVAN